MKSFKVFIRLFTALLVLGCSEVNTVKTLRLGHGLDVSHSVHKAMVAMGEDLAERSGGKLKLEIYPSQQLGTERECLGTIANREFGYDQSIRRGTGKFCS
ncbi:hypothetical protein [Maribacter litopenaei]|uniref:hypothetical protein n=1 Tax=Maribacter litopenaei TaxID=2976127 RepID=UPI0030840C6F